MKPKLKGVYSNTKGRFRAQFCHGGSIHHLGMYSSAEEAGRTWDGVCWTYRRDPNQLNFPDNTSTYDVAIPAVRIKWDAVIPKREYHEKAGGRDGRPSSTAYEPSLGHGTAFESLLRATQLMQG